MIPGSALASVSAAWSWGILLGDAGNKQESKHTLSGRTFYLVFVLVIASDWKAWPRCGQGPQVPHRLVKLG